MAAELSVRRLGAAALVLFASLWTAGSAAADGPSFFAPEVAENAVSAIVVTVGKPFDALGVRLTPSELTIDLIPTGSATDAQSWRVSHKGLVGGALGLDYATRAVSGFVGPIADNRFPFTAQMLAVVPKLAAEAIAKARLDTPGHVTEMELRRLPAIVGPASKTPIWQIHVAGVDEGADFGVDLTGKFTSSDLRRTHRAERLDLFAGGADFEEFLARIRQETGKAWVFQRIEIGKQGIGLDMRIASDPKGAVQRFNASISEIQTTAMDTPHWAFPGEAPSQPFGLADVDFSRLPTIEQAALEKLAIPKGAVNRVVISRPERENGAAIEWTVEVKPSDTPIFRMPGKPEPPEGSATFDGQGTLLRVVYPKGDPRRPNLFEPAALKLAMSDISAQLGTHEPVVELKVSASSLELRAADPKAPTNLVFFDYQDGLVSRSMMNSGGGAGVFGDGPDWRWDLALLTPEVIDRLPGLVQRAIAAQAKPNSVLSGVDFTKDKPFYPANTEPMIEIRIDSGGDSATENFDFSGGVPKSADAAPAKSGLFVNGKNVAGDSDEADVDGCENSEDWPAVIAACTRWLDHNPKEPTHDRAVEYYNRGNAHMNLKQWPAAIADYTTALKVDPSYQRPYTNRGYSYLSSGDAAHALVDASKAIALDPQKTFAYTVRGFAEERQGQWDAAIKDFTVTIEQSDGDAQAYFNRGLAWYSGKGDLDHAIADFGEAYAKDPGRADALVYRGIAHRLKGDLDGAIADHSQAVGVDPRNASAFFNRGMEYYLSGAMPKALADLTQAAALAPNELYLGLLLDVTAVRSGLPGTLKESSAKFDMAAWPAPAVRLLLQQLTPEALAAAAAEDGPAGDKPRRLCEAHFYTGVAFARAGKPDAAAEQWRQALTSCPKPTPERSYAEVELKAAGGKP